MSRPRLALAFAALMLAAGCAGRPSNDAGTGPDASAAEAAGNRTAEPVDPDENETVYHLGIIRTWDRWTLHVALVPPGYGKPGDASQVLPGNSMYVKAALDAMTHWKETIQANGSAEIRNLTFDVWVAVRDAVPPAWATSPDVLVIVSPGPPASGFAMNYPDAPNEACVIVDFLLPTATYEEMFLVHAHEFGHCLGLDHPRNHEPWIDLMAYDTARPAGAPLPRLDCVSNLDLLGLPEAFAPALKRKGSAFVEMNATDFVKFDCAQRFLGGGPPRPAQ